MNKMIRKMITSKLTLLLLFVAALSGVFLQAGSFDQEKFQRTLDEMLPQYKQVYDVPGMVVGVLKDGKVIYTKALGHRRKASDRKMSTRSLFHMASVSKPFMATAVMQLVEKGKLALDGKLITYLPYFKIADERYKEITLAQILRHNSGLPDVKSYNWDKPEYDEGAAERWIRTLVDEKLLYAPGTGFRYSNLAFDILADVVARAAGMPYEKYVAEYIFKPVGMKDSTFLKQDVPDSLANDGHVVGDVIAQNVVVSKIYPYNRRHAPSSTLHSNVEDMLRWGWANLNHGVRDGKRFLSAESHLLMWKPEIQARGDDYVGLSWFIGQYKGLKTISHGGGDTGFRTYFLMVPEQGLAVVTMGNSATMQSRLVIDLVLDAFLGEAATAPKKAVSVPLGRMILEKGITESTVYYHRLKKENPQRFLFNEAALNTLGYGLINKKMMQEAVEIFKLNVAEYPDSWNVYDSLAEAYMVGGDRVNAVKFYKTAYEKNPRKTGNEIEAGKNQQAALAQLEKQK